MDQSVFAIRYQGDVALLAAVRADPLIQKEVASVDVSGRQDMLRSALLGQGVRIAPRLIPTVHQAFEALRERTGLGDEVEAYVVPSPGINAFVTRDGSRTFVVLHGDTVNALNADELLFVIGHELGHAAFGHHEVAERRVFERLNPRQRMQLLALSRAQEISADRVGLLCCGNLDAAIRALFKCASGLTMAGLVIDPTEFDAQWDHYVNEVLEVGTDTSHGLVTHPLPHLRIRALRQFWTAGLGNGSASVDWGAVREQTDPAVDGLLAVLDPLARERPDAADPILADFFLWGGLFMALSHGEIGAQEQERIASVTSPAKLGQALAAGQPTAGECRQRFLECLGRRKQKLTASEIARILDGLTQIARADQNFADAEIAALRGIAAELKVNADLFIAA
jgi:hypothetical protein